MPFDGEAATLTLTLEVGRHWALTIWALLAYLLLFGLMLLAIRAYYHRRMARRERHLSEKRSLELALDEEKGKREEVMRSQQARDSIRQTLAQEMRSPLAMAIVPLKEIVSDALTPEDTRQKAQIAYHNAIYLQDICNQILRIYQQEATENTLNAAPYAVSELADEAVRTSRELLNVSDIRLDYDRTKRLTDTVWADRRKVVFVLGNVLSNAYRRISYTGTVEMRVGLAELHGQACCEFVCRDRSAKEPHPEIGLEVMQHIALIHGGDLTFNHTADEGTAVHLYLPLDKEHLEGKPYVHFVEPELPEVQGEEPLPPSATDDDENAALYDENQPVRLQTVNPETKYKVLVIEDNNDILLYMKVLLSNKYNVLLAMDGEEGIRVARKEEPDLILTDVMMPVMDGLECCRILKNDLKTCHIPVIMLTALTSDEDVMKGLETGADDYILKPFNPEILRSKIRNLIQSRVDLKRVYTRLLMTSAPADDNGSTEAYKQAESPFIAQIMELVNANLQSPDFSVKRLAEMMNMSQPTLYRRVKQLTNFTIVELIRGARLKQAAELLRTKRYSVQDVAERVGYNDVPTFRKHFIDLYGATPSTFNS
jgi:DNA-binding response OmpR family regulator